jgi:hypothetical protein
MCLPYRLIEDVKIDSLTKDELLVIINTLNYDIIKAKDPKSKLFTPVGWIEYRQGIVNKLEILLEDE